MGIRKKKSTKQQFGKSLLLLFLAAVFLSYVAVTLSGRSQQLTQQVVLSDSGFSPESITVKKGTTVIWKIEGKNPHWPASNFHPTHEEYPETGGCLGSKLDACRGLENGEKFSFNFNKEGTFGLHDHLYSAYTMTVIVRENGQTSGIFEKLTAYFGKKESTSQELELLLSKNNYTPEQLAPVLKSRCQRKEVEDDFACYARDLEKVVIVHGREHAIDTLYAIQKIDDRAKNCHFLAHGIGWGTYKRDPKKFQESIASSSPLCSYGEQMGIIEQYVSNLPSGKFGKEDVPNICGEKPRSDCNHAVGHMVLVYTKGDYDKAVDFCYALEDKLQRGHCLSGVMMEKFVEGNLREHGLKPAERANWPLKLWEQEHFCRTLTGELEMECWREIVHPAFFYFEKDPKLMFDFCQTAPREEIRRACKIHSIPEVAGDKGHDLNQLRSMCELERGRDNGFEEHCYLQLVAMRTGFLKPEESKDTIAFCNDLDPQFQSICFRAAGPRLIANGISKKELQNLCREVPPEYEGFCNGSVRAEPVNVHQ
jgi:plastocyanin